MREPDSDPDDEHAFDPDLDPDGDAEEGDPAALADADGAGARYAEARYVEEGYAGDDPFADLGPAPPGARAAPPDAPTDGALARRTGRVRRALSNQAALIARVRRRLPPRREPLRAVPDVGSGPAAPLPPEALHTDGDGRPLLRVLTLNLAHGRRDGFHQAFQRRDTIRRNLSAVAEMLRREAPDVVAFQEADGPSAWSGGFDHVAFVAEASGLPWRIRGTHVAGPRIDYGTAIATRLPVCDPLSITFAPSPPTFTKGFVIATVTHPAAPDCPVDIVSVHLDFSRAAIRRRQVETLIEELRGRDRLRIVVGDFNTGWNARERVLRRLADALGLRAHDPDAPLVTFPFHNARLDWIFASKALDIVEHAVLPDVVSDHRGVLAGLRLP